MGISPQAKERICSLVQSAVDQGAELMIDGRQVTVPEYPDGNFVGPTIITGMDPSMKAYTRNLRPCPLCGDCRHPGRGNRTDQLQSLWQRHSYLHQQWSNCTKILQRDWCWSDR